MKQARRSAPDAPRPHGPIRRALRRVFSATGVALFATAVVGGIAAAISYSHMLDWAKANDDVNSEWRAYLFPVSVDGAIVAASAVLYADSRAGRKSDKLAYAIIVVGILWSIIANIAHNTTGWGAEKTIAGWPPIALALVVEMVFRFVRRMSEQAEALATAQAEQARLAEAARVEAERVAAEEKRAAEEAAARRAEADERRRERAEQRERERAEQREQEPQADVVQLRATGTDGADRPAWLIEGATAEQAMLAYLAQAKGDVTGAELDRVVGIPYFGTTPGYGRKIARKYREQQESRQEEV
ncbi:DUF2637 domain-containing protein [Actinophytocola sp.]|uniref:DUF2637 domain-containing protein n=1 Tax=Actinophytocola sp. TaxID=1872138 RepID=UPI002D805E8F|nr:DUF2637 domain-containing protein [Actinophytocola sp.]HET9144182.1 DUF2637 domain-containing protein [Actinophytocola sp.]